MEVKTIYVNYDIRRMRPPNLIAFTHEKDKNTQVIELYLTDEEGEQVLSLPLKDLLEQLAQLQVNENQSMEN